MLQVRFPQFHLTECGGTVEEPHLPNTTADGDVGKMQHECVHCGALLFPGELTTKSKYGPFGMCCDNGRVKLPDFQESPQSLWDLLRGFRKKKYLKHSRQFNHAVAYASFKCHSGTLPGPISDMRIQGAAYVTSGGIRAETMSSAKFIQVYF